VMSMAFFQENEDEAIIWRGPMVHNAINQLLQTTNWGELDYLIVDLPPGTSDSPLTVMQSLSMDGFIIVTTPQELAKVDAKRSINMIRKLKVNILGIVENFSGSIFGAGAGKEIAEELALDYLGHLDIRSEYLDSNLPASLINNDILSSYRAISKKALASLQQA
ncbi:MAG: hypothetical protein BZY65_01750, partial [SAR202 cluster bacterium Ae2-Chloro-G2]